MITNRSWIDQRSRHLDRQVGLHANAHVVLLKIGVEPTLQFAFGKNRILGKQLFHFFRLEDWQSVGGRLPIQQASRLGLNVPLFAVAVAVKDDRAVLVHDFGKQLLQLAM